MAANQQPRFLLLLPPSPSPPSHNALKAAFGSTISEVLKEVASHSSDTSKPAILEIALSCPHLLNHQTKSRSSLYHSTQKLLAAIYKLICIVATQDNINLEDAEGVDVRVMLIAWSPDQSQSEKTRTKESAYGPVIGLQALAKCQRPWQYAFGVESESGEAMVRAFVAAKGSGEPVSRVQSGPVLNHASQSGNAGTGKPDNSAADVKSPSGERHHHHVAVGGTFDHLHIGHKLLLTMTAFAVDLQQEGCTATIGITGDQLLVNKKHASVLESWDDRHKYTQSFLDSIINFSPSSQPSVSHRNESGPNGKGIDNAYENGLTIKCTEIQDPFGPTITEERISALIISAETRSGGKAVNDKRKEKGWAELEVFEVDVLDAEEESDGATAAAKEGFDSKISSTAIREKIAKKKGGGML